MIVIPMAGLSRRFTKAGYEVPKYQLLAHGVTLFSLSVASFEKYFKTHGFLFICRDVAQTREFIIAECSKLGIKNYEIVVLKQETRGQAETVMLGIDNAGLSEDEPLTIFNIDTFRPGFEYPEELKDANGVNESFLEVFEGSGDNWSFARPLDEKSDRVIETSEKRPISKLCSTGLYHFKSVHDFKYAYNNPEAPVGAAEKSESYIAPMFNSLIKQNLVVKYYTIDRKDVVFCGVPSEYDEVKSSKYLVQQLLNVIQPD